MENIKPITSLDLEDISAKFSPYLSEVRKRLISIIAVFVVAMVVGFIFYETIVKFLIDIFDLDGINIAFTSPFQFINLAVSTALAVGLIVVLPFLVFQILNFLRPALMKKEFRMVTRFIPYSFVLFLVGFVFGIIIMKWQIAIFLDRSIALGIGNLLDISKLLVTIMLTSSFMGVAFQFPIALLLILRVGLIKRRQLSSKRKWVYLGSFFLAILLPLDSIIADVLLALPLIFLFEITLILDRRFEKKKARKKHMKTGDK